MNGHAFAGWMVNAVIAITLMEGVLLIALRLLRRPGPAPGDVVANLAAGLCLLGALRSEIAGQGSLACAAWLGAAGLSHAVDAWRRWPGAAAHAPHPDAAPWRSTTFPLKAKRQP